MNAWIPISPTDVVIHWPAMSTPMITKESKSIRKAVYRMKVMYPCIVGTQKWVIQREET